MRVVAGVDFGTLSVRVSIFAKLEGSGKRLATALAEYPLQRHRDDPNFATQSHEDHMVALERAMRTALHLSGVRSDAVDAIAIDTTGSSVIMVGEGLKPISDYYLWCDHRSWREAEEITAAAHRVGLEAIDWCGGTYSSEWGFSKVLHWLRKNPEQRGKFVTALEHCDMVTATLCGISDPHLVRRSICAMGHKWMWNPKWGGLPPQEFFTSIDPLFEGIREKITGSYGTSAALAGKLCAYWAERLGLREGILVPIGALDAHWDAIGANVRLGDLVNVIGTSTCIIGLSDTENLVPGVCGVVPGAVSPNYIGIEAGLSAVGDIFDAIAKRAGTTVGALSAGTENYRAGQTGLLRFSWDNGDRTVLANPTLSGMTLGWNLIHTAQDELFAAIEGTAFHTRIIIERMQEHGTPIHRIINGGGIPQRNDVLNQVYANVLNKPVLVPQGDTTSLGSAIFAFLATGEFKTVEEAQDAFCAPHRTFFPNPEEVAVYERLFALYRKLYFGFGQFNAEALQVGSVLPALREIAEEVHRKNGSTDR